MKKIVYCDGFLLLRLLQVALISIAGLSLFEKLQMSTAVTNRSPVFLDRKTSKRGFRDNVAHRSPPRKKGQQGSNRDS